jgi:hypothetical protein
MNITIKAIPEKELIPLQKTHLEVARQVAQGVEVKPALLINSVRIIGAYHPWSGPIYIAPQRLGRLRFTMNTTIHELAHHQSQAGDGTLAHERAISAITDQVAAQAAAGHFDRLLVEAVW